MHTHADKTQDNKTKSVSNAVSQKQNGGESTFQFVDNRPEAFAQRKLQDLANNYSAQQQIPIQKKENNTGLPANLKTGIENLSGYSMDNVKVYYNSDKPAQLQAHAYAQGTDIHLASGQEKHLPHEAWHVVQQKQGRVNPTVQMKGVNVNDDAGLEKEADVMGERASNLTDADRKSSLLLSESNSIITQRVIKYNSGADDSPEKLESDISTIKGSDFTKKIVAYYANHQTIFSSGEVYHFAITGEGAPHINPGRPKASAEDSESPQLLENLRQVIAVAGPGITPHLDMLNQVYTEQRFDVFSQTVGSDMSKFKPEYMAEMQLGKRGQKRYALKDGLGVAVGLSMDDHQGPLNKYNVRNVTFDSSQKKWMEVPRASELNQEQKPADGKSDFIISTSKPNVIIFLGQHSGESGHSSLMDSVLMAGQVKFNDGVLIEWSSASGHFKVPDELASQCILPIDKYIGYDELKGAKNKLTKDHIREEQESRSLAESSPAASTTASIAAPAAAFAITPGLIAEYQSKINVPPGSDNADVKRMLNDVTKCPLIMAYYQGQGLSSNTKIKSAFLDDFNKGVWPFKSSE